jgi:hypothetical protein
MLQDSCLGVVDKYFGWDTAKKLEGVLMGLEEVFGSLFEALQFGHFETGQAG